MLSLITDTSSQNAACKFTGSSEAAVATSELSSNTGCSRYSCDMIFSSSDIGGGRAISGRNGFGVVQADDVSDEGIDRSSDMSISLSAKSSQS